MYANSFDTVHNDDLEVMSVRNGVRTVRIDSSKVENRNQELTRQGIARSRGQKDVENLAKD